MTKIKEKIRALIAADSSIKTKLSDVYRLDYTVPVRAGVVRGSGWDSVPSLKKLDLSSVDGHLSTVLIFNTDTVVLPTVMNGGEPVELLKLAEQTIPARPKPAGAYKDAETRVQLDGKWYRSILYPLAP